MRFPQVAGGGFRGVSPPEAGSKGAAFGQGFEGRHALSRDGASARGSRFQGCNPWSGSEGQKPLHERWGPLNKQGFKGGGFEAPCEVCCGANI